MEPVCTQRLFTQVTFIPKILTIFFLALSTELEFLNKDHITYIKLMELTHSFILKMTQKSNCVRGYVST